MISYQSKVDVFLPHPDFKICNQGSFEFAAVASVAQVPV
ncbi:MAG: hypothetical protein ACI936_000869 [Paraglaciecola sp.]|jgi:hypothetical protein